MCSSRVCDAKEDRWRRLVHIGTRTSFRCRASRPPAVDDLPASSRHLREEGYAGTPTGRRARPRPSPRPRPDQHCELEGEVRARLHRGEHQVSGRRAQVLGRACLACLRRVEASHIGRARKRRLPAVQRGDQLARGWAGAKTASDGGVVGRVAWRAAAFRQGGRGGSRAQRLPPPQSGRERSARPRPEGARDPCRVAPRRVHGGGGAERVEDAARDGGRGTHAARVWTSRWWCPYVSGAVGVPRGRSPDPVSPVPPGRSIAVQHGKAVRSPTSRISAPMPCRLPFAARGTR